MGVDVKRAPRRQRPRGRRAAGEGETGHVVDMAGEMRAHPETSPRLTGGDVDADWRNATSAGDEAVGGSTATPDQDVVDELGEALGVPQEPDAELRPVAEILAERDRHRWQIERETGGDENEP